MAEIVNLNRARKQRARSEKEGQAAANRLKFGRTKAERRKSEAADELARKLLEGHRRSDADPELE